LIYDDGCRPKLLLFNGQGSPPLQVARRVRNGCRF